MIGADLLPPWVAQAVCDVPAEAPATRELPEPLRGAVLVRQKAFVAGRRAAGTALASLDVDHPRDVGIGARGEPTWPPGVVGSITHGAGQARCAAVYTRDAAGIGIDVEWRIGAARADRVRAIVASDAEFADRVWPSSLGGALRVTIAFSAKEALYKCLYPDVGRVFDFLDVAVSHVDLRAGLIGLRLESDLSARWSRGARLTGRFAVDDTRVVTAFLLQY
jgi:enterobactin synthetase component D